MSKSYLTTEFPPELVLALAESDDISLSSLNSLAQTCNHLHNIIQPELDAALTPEVASEVLLDAAKTNKPEVVAKLLAPPYSVDPNAYSGNSCTPLHAAAERGHVAVVMLLLAAKADVTRTWDSRIDDDMQPLHLAVLKGHVAVARLLLERGANPNTRYGEWFRYIICDAAYRSSIEMVETLLDYNANLEQRDTHGTPLGHAVARRDLGMIEYLLRRGAEVDAEMPLYPGAQCGSFVPPFKATALYFVLSLKHPKGDGKKRNAESAPKEGREKIMKLLLMYGAKKDRAMETVKQYLTGLADAEGISEEGLLKKVDSIFASVELSK
ncbi:Ankyrin repeat domain-containing protein 50 [Mycena indigotica]|uniref:Ankyrin repeat domain-containing protein 50 n=1 Tax=Mycena indigotica TaxID=2126181 RepID=A0A8H6T502_9AGAR|nr:Ankyrin repeat domain-containing protein 50 [Mycena indigotica]KAF7310032.1 Ankyrin repeat domain-containing protein 50 [Mycena indigotica]